MFSFVVAQFSQFSCSCTFMGIQTSLYLSFNFFLCRFASCLLIILYGLIIGVHFLLLLLLCLLVLVLVLVLVFLFALLPNLLLLLVTVLLFSPLPGVYNVLFHALVWLLLLLLYLCLKSVFWFLFFLWWVKREASPFHWWCVQSSVLLYEVFRCSPLSCFD